MKAVLVSIQLPENSDEEFLSSLDELKRLVHTLGYEVIGTITQRRKFPSQATAIGAGKLKELALWTGGTGYVPVHRKTTGIVGESQEPEAHDVHDEEINTDGILLGEASVTIFDQELSPNQLKNLQQATGSEVLDRTGVIVEIFHRHAKTREAKLQVEIARLNYVAPRVRVAGGGDRQGGGVGSKGAGETSHELDRRRIRDRVAELQRELEVIREDHLNRRANRQDQLSVALVGYTNAGKSSLMRALTGNEVLVADKLFATLDTTVRTLKPDIFPKILVSDTVGFIKKLPHDLVASFRSTLDEAADASLLLFVVDSSDPAFRSQLEVTQTVLNEIGATEIPSLIILNKMDNLDIAQVHLLKREFPDALMISTRNPEDIVRVTQTIRNLLTTDLVEDSILVPYDDKKGLVGEIRRTTFVLEETYEEAGVRFRVKSYPKIFAKLRS